MLCEVLKTVKTRTRVSPADNPRIFGLNRTGTVLIRVTGKSMRSAKRSESAETFWGTAGVLRDSGQEGEECSSGVSPPSTG